MSQYLISRTLIFAVFLLIGLPSSQAQDARSIYKQPIAIEKANIDRSLNARRTIDNQAIEKTEVKTKAEAQAVFLAIGQRLIQSIAEWDGKVAGLSAVYQQSAKESASLTGNIESKQASSLRQYQAPSESSTGAKLKYIPYDQIEKKVDGSVFSFADSSILQLAIAPSAQIESKIDSAMTASANNPDASVTIFQVIYGGTNFFAPSATKADQEKIEESFNNTRE